jgi:catechol 2,3-dioxygenase-like lactoylglutathione lyase family enzyme
MTTVNVRYMVGDVEAAVAFSTTYLGFTLVTGPGGSQILLDDPSGNPIELFQPRHE